MSFAYGLPVVAIIAALIYVLVVTGTYVFAILVAVAIFAAVCIGAFIQDRI